MQVTPKIGPDGQVLMRIIPEVSSVDPVPVNLGNGNISTALDIQHLETTVTANDGETIVLGGLLTKRNDQEREQDSVARRFAGRRRPVPLSHDEQAQERACSSS